MKIGYQYLALDIGQLNLTKQGTLTIIYLKFKGECFKESHCEWNVGGVPGDLEDSFILI